MVNVFGSIAVNLVTDYYMYKRKKKSKEFQYN